MSYAVSALIGLLIGVGSIFSPQPAQPDQEKAATPAVERKKDGA